MSTSSDSRIDAFLDGRMDPSERQAFLELLAQDEHLGAELDRQLAIDASLRRVCSETRIEPLLDRIEDAIVNEPDRTSSIHRSVRVWRFCAAACFAVISMCGLWYSWTLIKPPPVVDVYEVQPWRSFATVYSDTIRDGFKPAWICRNERQFERAFSRRFRQPLLLATLPSGVTAGGISYSNTITASTINVLGDVEGTPVIIFVDKLADEHGPPPPLPPGLHLFRREIDNLVLYEVTPLDGPRILPFFYNPSNN